MTVSQPLITPVIPPPVPITPVIPPIPQASPIVRTNEAIDSALRKPGPEPALDSEAVVVAAVRCPNGHYSPPYANLCRVCGVGIDQNQTPIQIPRPPLGILRLWAGGEILLDRGVIFGRNPHLTLGVPGPQPSLVRIDDPNRDVSSQHCEVRLEDWYVSVRDLNSTNGTQVILPHRQPVALRPNDPMVIEPGTRVVLANAFDFLFEVA